jgi:FlaA1/EpsC-like NDP-sugar epimerase
VNVLNIPNKLLKTLCTNNIQALLCLDFILLPLALLTSVFLRLGGDWDHRLDHSIWLFIALPLWTIPIFIKLGLYRAVIRYLDEKIVVIVLSGVSLSVLILISVIHFTHIYAFPKTSIIIFWVFALAYIGGTRLILRGILRNLSMDATHNKINVAIYGAGTAGVQLCLALQNSQEYFPVAFLDDDNNKSETVIRGVTVYHPQLLATILQQRKIEQVLLAIPSASLRRHQEIINFLEPFSLKIRTLPGIADLISGMVTVNDIKEIEIEDLLGREVIPADSELLQKNITNCNVLITGAGGSIGSELAKQISELHPRILVLFDVSEFALYKIERHIRETSPNIKLISILGSITSNSLVDKVISQYNINTIYHAAAYKHVPIVEFNPISGTENNVIGTYILATNAIKYNVRNMVLISTDKAVRPTNIMGATKRLAEMILQALQIQNDQTSSTIFTMVRFGNVLGSSGSVVPLFKNQIKHGGPVTVTHSDVIRYFMTITEAVQLVIQASNMATGGEVFVLDMGQPVKIVDLARRMIHLSGRKIKDSLHPDGDIEIKLIGLRPGEKLYEELLTGDDSAPTLHPRIMKANETYLPFDELITQLDSLKIAINMCDSDKIMQLIKQLIVDYKPT